MQFRTTVLLSGKTATGIQVPAEVVEELGAGKRPPVRVTINGYTYRSTIAPLGGVFMVGISAEVREWARVQAGDEIDVVLELDTQPREVQAPPDLAEALAGDVEARRFFDSLSFSNKQRLVLSIEGARTPETRQRRIARAVEALHAGKL